MILDMLLIETSNNRLRVKVNVDAEIVLASIAQRQENKWLVLNAGNLLGTSSHELYYLGQQLVWRFDIMLGNVTDILDCIGFIDINAETGEPTVPQISLNN